MRDNQSRRRFASTSRPRLVLGGIAAAGIGMSLGGCSSNVQPAQFTSVTECTSAGFDQNLCQAGYAAAFQQHQASAPQFRSLDACEAEWGDNSCTPGYGASNVFVPLLAGFVLSTAMQQSFYDDGEIDIDFHSGRYRGTPIYKNRSGASYAYNRSGGTAKMTPVNVNTTTVARSGFGGMGSSRGGWGG